LKRQISAFVSASSEQQDTSVVRWFSGILRKNDVEPIFATDLPEPRPPPQKIKDLIEKSDFFIAILTKREKIEGRNLWKGPDWVQNEIGYAIAKKKPFALFVEERIDPNQGLGHWETEYIIFDRKSLRKIRSKTEKIIVALKKQIADETKTQETEEAIIEESEASLYQEGIIGIGRFLVEQLYGRLDVSLWKTYMVLLVLSLPSAYFVYDYMYGRKIVGLWGDVFCLGVLIVSLLFVSSAEGTKCRKCRSYFSVRERPVLASDIRKLPKIPNSRRYHKWVCDVCGNSKFKAKDRERQED
jgi:nucleoside 2-deoxyribosyltransferase